MIHYPKIERYEGEGGGERRKFFLFLPPPPTSIFFFRSRFNFRAITRWETLATQAVNYRILVKIRAELFKAGLR